MASENKTLTQISPRSIELQFQLGRVRSSNPGRAVWQRLKRDQSRSPGIASGALLARIAGPEQRLRRLQHFELALGSGLGALCEQSGSLRLIPLEPSKATDDGHQQRSRQGP